jgi:hypothetical protein
MYKIFFVSKTRIRSCLAAGIYSLILFSQATYVFTIGGKYFLEIAVLAATCFYLIFRDPIGKEFARALYAKRGAIASLTFIIAMFLVIGFFRHGNLADAYSEYRSNVLLTVGFLVGGYVLRSRPDYLYILAMFTAAYSLVYWILLYFTGQLSVKFATPLFAPIVAALVSADRGKTIQLIPAIVAILFLAAVSFFRQYWLAALFVVGACLFQKHGGASGSFSRKALVAAFVTLIVFSGYGFIYTLFESNESLRIQSIEKTADALSYLEGGHASDSDNLRMSYFNYMYDQFFNLILPHGLALGTSVESENFDEWFTGISDASNTADSLLLFIAYHYGYVVLVPLTVWLITKTCKAQLPRGVLRLILLLLTLVVPLLFDGGQALVPLRAFWFGVFCTYLVTPQSQK